MNPLPSVTDYRRGGELRDPAAFRAALHPDVVLRSPLSDRIRFAGRDQVLEVIEAALGTFEGLRYHTEIGDDRTRVLLSSGMVDGVPFDETTVLRVADDGRIAEIALSIRPLPAAAALLRVLGARLMTSRGKPLAGRAVRVGLGPLVGLVRLADRMSASAAG